MDFKEQQRRLIEQASQERKEALKKLREDLEREYQENKPGWYDSDNDARSPLEADWDDIREED